MFLRTRLTVLTGAAFLATGGLAAIGVATAGATAVAPLCDGLPATIVVAAPNMVTNGGAGNDVIVGTNGRDVINGLAGDDRICALDGDDDMRGNAGNDRMDGGSHIEGDRGDGGPGADLCVRTETRISC